MSVNKQIQSHKVVSEKEWVAARKELLKKEKEFTRRRDELTKERLSLPWVKVEKEYAFEGPNGRQTLAELFDGRSQLIIYHFMFGPEWEQGCVSCSFVADTSLNGSFIHLAQRDVTLVAVSRAPFAKIEEFKKRMGWNFHWVSSNQSDFNWDFRVSFTPEEVAAGEMYYNFQMQSFPSSEAPGISVFYKDETGNIFHTYSSYARGLDVLIGAYHYLDQVPKGRNEEGFTNGMQWVRHHDRYDNKYFGDSIAAQQLSAENSGHHCCAEEKTA